MKRGTGTTALALTTLVLMAGAPLAGCVSDAQQRKTVRICDSDGCSVRDASIETFVPQDDPRTKPPRDADNYSGESVEGLRAAAAGGDVVSAYKLGMASLSGAGGQRKDPTAAARWFRTAADAGHSWAAYRLGELYRGGRGVAKDRSAALSYLNAAAQARQPLAANALGVMALTGDGLPKDTAQAAYWFTIAAEQGVADAQYNLALLYYHGDGVGQDLHLALQWMRAAAGNGTVKAQTAVGRLYLTGLDTMGQDLPEAETWLTMASQKGDGEASKLLADLRRQQKEERDYQRKLTELAAQTMLYWAQSAYVRELNTTTVYHYWYW